MTSVLRSIQMGNFNAPHYQRTTCMAHDSVKTLISNAKVGSVWDTLLVEYTSVWDYTCTDMHHHEFFTYLICSTAVNFLHCKKEIGTANVIHTCHCQQ